MFLLLGNFKIDRIIEITPQRPIMGHSVRGFVDQGLYLGLRAQRTKSYDNVNPWKLHAALGRLQDLLNPGKVASLSLKCFPRT